MASRKTASATRRRYDPSEREEMILDAAGHYFATYGFAARTRDLAEHAGISPALIFKYFGSKHNLIERVYQRLYISRWNETWRRRIADRSQPFRERIRTFYLEFFEVSDDYDWVRCGLFSGLDGQDLSRRHYQARVMPVLQAMARELRHARGEVDDEPNERDVETVWHLHSTFVYFAIRKHVHERSVWDDHAAMVDHIVSLFLNGALAQPKAGNGTGH